MSSAASSDSQSDSESCNSGRPRVVFRFNPTSSLRTYAMAPSSRGHESADSVTTEIPCPQNSWLSAEKYPPASSRNQSEDEAKEEFFREELSHCAPEPSAEDYERMPVNCFGEALLRGMGWSPGRAVGRRGVIPPAPYIFSLRASRLGLGASVPTLLSSV